MKYRRLLTALVALMLIFLAAGFLAEKYLERNYTGKLIPVADDIGIVFGEVDVRLLRGSVRLSEISIPDSLARGGHAELNSVDISGIQWLELIRKRKVKIKNVSLNGLSADIDLSMIKKSSGRSDSIARILAVDLPRLDLEFDRDMNPTITAVDARNISYHPEAGNYNFEIRGIRAEDPTDIIVIDSFIMNPRYPKFEFGFRNGRRMGSVDLVVPEIHLHKLDLVRLKRDSVIDLRNIELIAPTVNIFTDKRLPVDMDRYVAMPHESLLKANTRIDIDSLNIKSMHFRFETINPNSLNEGYIEFEHAFIAIGNVTNIPERIGQNNVMSLDLFARFMNAADLNAHFQFYLDRQDYYFKWYGDLSGMQISEIDRFTIPVANMNIIEGDCESLEFSLESDMDSARGTLDFQYRNLKVMAIDPETHQHRRFLSGVANLFFLKEDNFKGEPSYRQGTIQYAHETNRGLEHYLWTSLQQGLLSTILPHGIAQRIDETTASDQSEMPRHNERHKKRKKNKKKN